MASIRKYLVLGLISFGLAQGGLAQEILIKGKIRGLDKNEFIYLRQPILGQEPVDSVLARNGRFQFRRQLPEGDFFFLQAGGNSLLLYLQPGKVKITGIKQRLTKAKLSGSSFIKDFVLYNKQMAANPYIKQLEATGAKLEDAKKAKDDKLLNELTIERDTLRKKSASVRNTIGAEWLTNHPQSDINAFVLYFHPFRREAPELLQARIAGFSENARNSAVGQLLLEAARSESNTAVGKLAPGFTQSDTAGKAVSLQDFRGRYVLVDFWASWCKPCREENPYVVQAFQQYKDKGFTVLGISLDRPGDKAKWLEAIHADGLTWTHVSDLRYWKNEVAVLYGIQSIPANFLIDPQGKIVGRNLRGEALQKELSDIFH